MDLLNKAKEIRENAYAPYSKFKVGAVLLCKDGSIYTGCNIENASYSATICAERVAFSSAIVDGKREFSAIAVVGNENPCFPCGICRQFMNEFCGKHFKIILEGGEYTLGELLPNAFEVKI